MFDQAAIIGIVGILAIIGVIVSQFFVLDWKIRQIEDRVDSLLSEMREYRWHNAIAHEEHDEKTKQEPTSNE